MTAKDIEGENGFQAIRFDGEQLALLDQRLLPVEERWLELADVEAVGAAIRDLVVRGAPAIGITAAYAAVIAARARTDDPDGWHRDLERLEQARPTAVNLGWALERMRRRASADGGVVAESLEAEAREIHAEDIAANRALARFGSGEIAPGSGVLTHCNTGSLATGGIGTALGVIAEGYRQQRIARVFAGETRPWLQGSRLTAWELARLGIPSRVIIDAAAGALMASGQVQWVVTGADRIAANGDVANKIGTYGLAVLARHHGVKFMVAAPSSTIDTVMDSGEEMAIEQRDPGEIWKAAGLERPPDGLDAWNPVFDVTPAELIDCIVTENGVYHPPFELRDA